MDKVSGNESRLFVGALARGLQVLAAFGEGRTTMNLVELTEVTGLSKSAIQRFTHTLEAAGYLKKDPKTKRYSLTVYSLAIGLNYLQGNPLISKANPYLHSLCRISGESCSVSERDGTDVVFLARFPSHKELFFYLPIGARLPMYCTAPGRAILSKFPIDETNQVLQNSKLVSYTANTITDPQRIIELVEEARSTGFSWADSEVYNGDINISAPILDRKGIAIGAVNISVPSSRWSIEEARRVLGPQVVQTALAISAKR